MGRLGEISLRVKNLHVNSHLQVFVSLFCLGCPHPPAGINHQILPEHFLCAKHRGLWGIRVVVLVLRAPTEVTAVLLEGTARRMKVKVKVKVLVTQLCPTILPTRLLCPGFSRQEYWSGLPFPPPGDLPDPGIEP